MRKAKAGRKCLSVAYPEIGDVTLDSAHDVLSLLLQAFAGGFGVPLVVASVAVLASLALLIRTPPSSLCIGSR
jgi:hypothetical protein